MKGSCDDTVARDTPDDRRIAVLFRMRASFPLRLAVNLSPPRSHGQRERSEAGSVAQKFRPGAHATRRAAGRYLWPRMCLSTNRAAKPLSPDILSCAITSVTDFSSSTCSVTNHCRKISAATSSFLAASA